MNLPNKLTVLRIILMPVMVVLFYLELYVTAAAVFIFAALTDMLDGKIARKNNLVTVFGKFVDPLADKLINIAAITVLSAKIYASGGWYGIFAVVTTVVIIARETIITSLRALAANEGVVIAADKLGKLKTVVQDVAIVAMFIDEAPYLKGFVGEMVHWTAVVLLVGALVLTIVSGINYFTSNKVIMEKITKDI
jgi:CDP-diacylglycerol--glycerol-3-phosphate 3-phosphatidyltransferase